MENLPFHDLDLGVYAADMDPKSANSYGLQLGAKLDADLKIPVDVRVINFVPVTFLYHVMRGELIINKIEDLLSGIIEKMIQKYFDLQTILLRATKEAFVS